MTSAGPGRAIGPDRLFLGAPTRVGWIRSYLADGRLVQWRPPPYGRWTIDAEIAAQPVPPSLARRYGEADPDRFWPRWTLVEAAAKLLDVPVLTWLHRHGLSTAPARAAGLHLAATSHAGITIALAGRATH